MITAQHVVDEHLKRGPWRELEHIALRIVDGAQKTAQSQMSPVLGGDTALSLWLRHRISDGISLVIRDAQWIGHITPRLNDDAGVGTTGYEESGDFVKLQYPQGEIDFIVRMSLLGDEPRHNAKTSFPVEPVSEILAKKLFHRGWALTPRDLFDWWSICALAPGEIDHAKFGRLLHSRADGIRQALRALPLSQTQRLHWEAIRAPFKPKIEAAASIAEERLADYERAAQAARAAQAPALPEGSGDSSDTPAGHRPIERGG